MYFQGFVRFSVLGEMAKYIIVHVGTPFAIEYVAPRWTNEQIKLSKIKNPMKFIAKFARWYFDKFAPKVLTHVFNLNVH